MGMLIDSQGGRKYLAFFLKNCVVLVSVVFIFASFFPYLQLYTSD